MQLDASDNWWTNTFEADKSGDADFISRDGTILVEVKAGANGLRSLHSGILKLASLLTRRSKVERACLVLLESRMSSKRLISEWRDIGNALKDDIARRLAIVAIDSKETWIEPDEPIVRSIAKVFEISSTLHKQNSNGSGAIVGRTPTGQKYYEVLKVLLNRWLRREGSIQVGKLAEAVGCTYPTIAQAMIRLPVHKSLKRLQSRSIELISFPIDAWNELVARSRYMRPAIHFVDSTGGKSDPLDLLTRLERIKPPQVAVGGVTAARFWHPDFDLHGTPRLDLSLHAPDEPIDLSFVRTMDPALNLAKEFSSSSVLVIHPIARASSLFENQAGAMLPWADPVETALDLYELGLTQQAGDLINHLRPEARL